MLQAGARISDAEKVAEKAKEAASAAERTAAASRLRASNAEKRMAAVKPFEANALAPKSTASVQCSLAPPAAELARSRRSAETLRRVIRRTRAKYAAEQRQTRAQLKAAGVAVAKRYEAMKSETARLTKRALAAEQARCRP